MHIRTTHDYVHCTCVTYVATIKTAVGADQFRSDVYTGCLWSDSVPRNSTSHCPYMERGSAETRLWGSRHRPPCSTPLCHTRCSQKLCTPCRTAGTCSQTGSTGLLCTLHPPPAGMWWHCSTGPHTPAAVQRMRAVVWVAMYTCF